MPRRLFVSAALPQRQRSREDPRALGGAPGRRAPAVRRRSPYHINATDAVTRWQVVATVQTISQAHLLPVIEQLLEQFPFVILGFHADNGSNDVNH